MAVSSINSNNNDAGGQYGTGSSAADLSQNFMTLLVAQMQNQDPTNPMDNNQLTSQLAQFNMAAGVEKMNQGMEAMYGLVGQLGSMSAASWVGRSVLIAGDPKVSFGEGVGIDREGVEPSESGKFSFALNSDADTVTVTLTDDEGKAYTAELKNVKSGVQEYSLDDLENFKPEPGPPKDREYTLTFEAKNAEGENPTATGLIQEQVQGVTMMPGGAMLHLKDHDPIEMGDVVVIQK
ncbi:flagellar hook assembly protein FlgD [Enterobacteriaceae bacterium C23F]